MCSVRLRMTSGYVGFVGGWKDTRGINEWIQLFFKCNQQIAYLILQGKVSSDWKKEQLAFVHRPRLTRWTTHFASHAIYLSLFYLRHDGCRLYRWLENRAASLHPVADAPASTGRVSLPLDKHYGHKATREDAFVARTGGSALMILVTNKLIVYCVSFFRWHLCVCARAFSFRVWKILCENGNK